MPNDGELAHALDRLYAFTPLWPPLLEHAAFRLNRASCSRFLKTHRLARKTSTHFFARCSRRRERARPAIGGVWAKPKSTPLAARGRLWPADDRGEIGSGVASRRTPALARPASARLFFGQLSRDFRSFGRRKSYICQISPNFRQDRQVKCSAIADDLHLSPASRGAFCCGASVARRGPPVLYRAQPRLGFGGVREGPQPPQPVASPACKSADNTHSQPGPE
jgi:hypothetical protein